MNISVKKYLKKFRKFKLTNKLSPARIIIIGFIAIIVLGTIMLMLPISSASHEPASFVTALFTSASATCVTALVMVDTASYWSVFGQFVILALVQIGGLGFMSIGIFASIILKKRVSPKTRLVFAQSMNLSNVDGIFKLAKKILTGTLVFELSGALLLSIRFIPIFGIADGIYKSIFTSISAFCNAGFDLLGNYSGHFTSFTSFASDRLVNFTISSLIIVGGVGFIVWDDVSKYVSWRYALYKQQKKLKKSELFSNENEYSPSDLKMTKLTVYTKLVLIISIILIIAGTIAFFAIEYSNPDTIGNMNFSDKLLVSYFQSVTSRTAGFSTVDISDTYSLTKFILIILMFIGGSSGSCAGGVKTVTFGLMIIAMFQISQGKKEVSIFKRSVSTENVLRAMTISAYGAVICLVSVILLTLIENASLGAAIFECVSAFTTVGFSFDLTPTLSLSSQILLILVMFLGRVGVMTFAFGVFLKMSTLKTNVKYVETTIFIG